MARTIPPISSDAVAGKPKMAVYKFSSCDGCQLQVLNLEEALLDLAEVVEIAFFLEARSTVTPGPYDIGLVEGSISTPREEEQIKQVRRQCRVLVTIGACATSGGPQALRNWADLSELAGYVYPEPQHLQALETSTPIAAHVFVDFELRGCPINHFHVIELVSALLARRRPNISTHSLCIDCKRRGWPCVLVAQGKPCLGPITQVGCGTLSPVGSGALCPAYERACYGCFGPMEQPNMGSLGKWFTEKLGYSTRDMKRMLRQSNGYLEPFKQASDRYEERERQP